MIVCCRQLLMGPVENLRSSVQRQVLRLDMVLERGMLGHLRGRQLPKLQSRLCLLMPAESCRLVQISCAGVGVMAGAF